MMLFPPQLALIVQNNYGDGFFHF